MPLGRRSPVRDGAVLDHGHGGVLSSMQNTTSRESVTKLRFSLPTLNQEPQGMGFWEEQHEGELPRGQNAGKRARGERGKEKSAAQLIIKGLCKARSSKTGLIKFPSPSVGGSSSGGDGGTRGTQKCGGIGAHPFTAQRPESERLHRRTLVSTRDALIELQPSSHWPVVGETGPTARLLRT